MAHVVGDDMRQMVDAYFAGNVAAAQKLHVKLYDVFKTMFITSNPVPIKYALKRLGMDMGGVRQPLYEANEAQKAKIDECLEKLNLLTK